MAKNLAFLILAAVAFATLAYALFFTRAHSFPFDVVVLVVVGLSGIALAEVSQFRRIRARLSTGKKRTYAMLSMAPLLALGVLVTAIAILGAESAFPFLLIFLAVVLLTCGLRYLLIRGLPKT